MPSDGHGAGGSLRPESQAPVAGEKQTAHLAPVCPATVCRQPAGGLGLRLSERRVAQHPSLLHPKLPYSEVTWGLLLGRTGQAGTPGGVRISILAVSQPSRLNLRVSEGRGSLWVFLGCKRRRLPGSPGH